MNMRGRFYRAGIYRIDTPSGSYIGKSKHVNKRLRDQMRKPTNGSKLLEEAVYSAEGNITGTVIARCPVGELAMHERNCIDHYNTVYPNGLNMRAGDSCNPRKRKRR